MIAVELEPQLNEEAQVKSPTSLVRPAPGRMARKALVTGATGLLGREVLNAFQTAGWGAVGTGFTRATPPSTLKVDLNSQEEIAAVLDEVK